VQDYCQRRGWSFQAIAPDGAQAGRAEQAACANGASWDTSRRPASNAACASECIMPLQERLDQCTRPKWNGRRRAALRVGVHPGCKGPLNGTAGLTPEVSVV
jgi:hypothetical protein